MADQGPLSRTVLGGRYQLGDRLGTGGFADVYLAEHLHLKTQRAIKVLKTGLASQQEIEQFRREAKTIAALKHPYILQVRDFDLENGFPFLVMDYAPNGTLGNRHPKGAQVPLDMVVEYVKQVAEALQYAHNLQVIHLDVKPENMLLDASGKVLLADFGIALMLRQNKTHQTQSNFVGTVTYAAPEQLLAKPGLASDQYALATVVYRWLTGRFPFDEDHIILHKLQDDPTPLCRYVPGLAPAVEEVVLRALARDSEDRFSSVQAFAKALEQASVPEQSAKISGVPTPIAPSGSIPTAPTAPTSLTPRRQRALFVSSAYPAASEASAHVLAHCSLFCLLSGVSSTVGVLTQSWQWAIGALALLTLGAYLLGYRRAIAGHWILLLMLLSGLIASGLAWWASTLNYAESEISYSWFSASNYTTSLPAQFCSALILGMLLAFIPGFAVTEATGEIDKDAGYRMGCLSSIVWLLIMFLGTAFHWGLGFGFGWWFSLIGLVIGVVGGNGLATAIPIWLQAIRYGPWSSFKSNIEAEERVPAPLPAPPTPASAVFLRVLLLIILVGGGLVGLGFAHKGPFASLSAGHFTEFPIPTPDSSPSSITVGPDGNLWFTENDGNKIGRITPAGQITEFALPTANSGPEDITKGLDGNLWFTESNGNKIGRIAPAGQVTEFTLPIASSTPLGITAGPDGNLWFTENHENNIGRITLGGSITEFGIPTSDSLPDGITAGPDGNLWFTESDSSIGRITPEGKITEFPLPSVNWSGDSVSEGITKGPDGNLWFTEPYGNIGRITPEGKITEFVIPRFVSIPSWITAGPDGNLWFTERTTDENSFDDVDRIGSITPRGGIIEFDTPTSYSNPYGITTGPDGNLWFTENYGNKIGRITL